MFYFLDSRNKKSISVRGKLVDKYRNKLRQNKRILADISDITSSTDQESEASNDVTSEALEISIKWLETNREPWEVVESHWKATGKPLEATIRLQDNRNNRNTSLSEILEKWPILTHPMSWLLIVQDSENFELSSSEDAISQWPQFFQNVLKVYPLEKKKIARVNELLQIIGNDQSDETKAIAQLCALSYMIPPRGRVKTTKKGHWKPSMIESEENLVVHVKTAGDISDIRQKRIDAMYQMNLTLQPYIIGPTLAEISSFFISVDKILYNVTSAFRAIDTFKIFHVLNIEYPAVAHHIWILIQHELYNFTTKYDKIPSHILEIMTKPVKEILKSLGWDILPHPPYSPDLAPSDYHLFTSMGHALAEQHFSNFEEVGKWLDEWFAAKDK
ncbi:uncharacterized protein LOC112588519 [Harpegnathos saltator]|uniref:uncharacterized protein LOC112588519 n=1 Tax=Harpegnathos saltator TaxID=610380 RepID=UPI000DBEDF51|nr:uncharacterized protein LOC112588519 [Harpegnathos saltator]